jgi:hypothetical protein
MYRQFYIVIIQTVKNAENVALYFLTKKREMNFTINKISYSQGNKTTPYSDKEKQKAYMRDYSQKQRDLLKKLKGQTLPNKETGDREK